MKYRRLIIIVSLLFLIGIYLVAENLNQQLCCRAAPVFDIQVLEDSLQVSVLNSPCSFKLPPVLKQLGDVPIYEMREKASQRLIETAGKLNSLGQALWNNIQGVKEKARRYFKTDYE